VPANSDTSTYNWTTEVARGAKAKSRGAIVFGTPWSPPAEMKTNNDTVSGSLKTTEYTNYKNHLVNFTNHARNNGCELYAISVQNEPDYKVTYVSCDWTATELRNFVRDQMGTFASTKVIASESFNFNLAMTDPILNDTTASNNLDIVGGHAYGATIQNYALAKSKGKEIWMTEYFVDDQTMTGVLKSAKSVHDCLHTGQYNAYVYWYLRSSNSPLDANGNRSKRGCVFSQWSRAVQPGYVRVDSTANPTSGIYVTAFKGSGKYVIVAVNNSTTTVSQQFSISGATLGTMTRWRTSSSEDLSTITSINASSGSFWASLPAQSVTTLIY
jgi:glucuronoarabinoxylan endo-1,4-beta-xylanase